MRSERARGVTLRVLNLDEEVRKARQIIRDRAENYDLDVSIGYAPWAAAEADGKLYAICHEGVGSEITPDRGLEIPIYEQARPGFMTIYPSANMVLTQDEVRSLMDEEIDLADLVRVFGARLEDNFRMWHRILGGKAVAQ